MSGQAAVGKVAVHVTLELNEENLLAWEPADLAAFFAHVLRLHMATTKRDSYSAGEYLSPLVREFGYNLE